ncbi:MAG TPA: hypothetical protein VH117_06775 [Edaphobacter sp.]|jgi:hypothetical protein|nr:hypothetical protein [Edaphobacter sp.]
MTSAIFQILAILVGGVFAVVKFGLLESPTLQKNLGISGSLTWEDRSDTSCIGMLDIAVTNLSKSTTIVSKVHGQAWLVNEPSGIQKGLSYFDINKLTEGKNPDAHFEYVDGPLVQDYTPGKSAHHTFEWPAERKGNTYALFKVEVFERGHEDKPARQLQWDKVCGGQESSENPGPD